MNPWLSSIIKSCISAYFAKSFAFLEFLYNSIYQQFLKKNTNLFTRRKQRVRLVLSQFHWVSYINVVHITNPRYLYKHTVHDISTVKIHIMMYFWSNATTKNNSVHKIHRQQIKFTDLQKNISNLSKKSCMASRVKLKLGQIQCWNYIQFSSR